MQPCLTDLEIIPIWLVISPTAHPTLIHEEQVSDTPAGQVMWGYSKDATTVKLSVLPDGTTGSTTRRRPPPLAVRVRWLAAVRWAGHG